MPAKKTKKTTPAAAATPPFMTAPDSPFPDKYDLTGEAKVLKHLIEADQADTADPLFPRFFEYEERLRQFKNMQAIRTSRQAAQDQATAVGMLKADEEDKMTLHTRDAVRLFTGRMAEGGARSITGGRRVAASLRQLWALSANDNPYADWLLVQFDTGMSDFRQAQAKETEKLVQRLEEVKKKGLSYSILKSDRPLEVGLGFVSPYGFTVAGATVEFDWASRVVKSAQRRDVVSSDEAHGILFALKRACRSVFEPAVRGASLLTREELRQLTRADFLSSDEMAMKRVEAVQGLFGKCPRDIYIGKIAPRHTRRSVRLTEQELRLLESVPFADETPGAAESQLIE